jgi:hypothetical protein
VPVEELDALTAGYDPLIDARELSVADKRRLQAHLAQQQQLAEAEDQPQQTPLPEVMSAAEHDTLIEQLRAVARHPWQLIMEERWRDGCRSDKPPGGAPRSLAEPSLPALTQPDHKPSEAHGSLLEMLEVGRGVLLELQGEVEAGLRSPTDGQLRAVQSNVECLEAKIAEPARADAVGLRFRC